jgi:hypothetical protein
MTCSPGVAASPSYTQVQVAFMIEPEKKDFFPKPPIEEGPTPWPTCIPHVRTRNFYDGSGVLWVLRRGLTPVVTRYHMLRTRADITLSSHIILGVYLIIFGLGKFKDALHSWQGANQDRYCSFGVPDSPAGGPICLVHVLVPRSRHLLHLHRLSYRR